LWLRAFDLKEPWITHRKFEVFEDKYSDLFGRPEVTADRIVMLSVIMEAIWNALASITNKAFAGYALTRYLLLYIVREMLEADTMFEEITTRPDKFVRDEDNRKKFKECVSKLINDALIDLNAEIESFGENFYYRDRLRDATWVRDVSRKVVSDYQKLVKRGRIPCFSDEWTKPA
jgi:hypothetical protein